MIYIIDDDKYVRKGFEILLNSAGFKSVSRENVEEFLKEYDPSPDDLLILDIQMPGMNGCDLLEYFIMQAIHVPVIIVTAYDERSSHECAERYGVLAFLRKPVDGELLINLIMSNQSLNSKI